MTIVMRKENRAIEMHENVSYFAWNFLADNENHIPKDVSFMQDF